MFGLTWGNVIEALALFSALIAVYISLRKSPHEIKQIEASVNTSNLDTMKGYITMMQEIANDAASRAMQISARLEEAEKRCTEQDERVRLINEKLRVQDDKIVTLNDKIKVQEEKIKRQDKKILLLEQENRELKLVVERLTSEKATYMHERAALIAWADRLVKQVQASDQTPSKLENGKEIP